MPGHTVAVPHANIVRILTGSMKEMFGTMFGSETTLKESFERPQLLEFHGISGIVGLGGELRGTAVFQCSNAVALSLTRQMLGEESPSPQLLRDAVGELANILAGGIKKQLVELGTVVALSVPTVIEGRPHLVSGIGTDLWTTVRMDARDGECLAAARLGSA